MVIRSRVVVCVLGLGLALPARAAAPERELSLEEILRYANEHAPEVTISARRVGIAEADVVAAAPWFPADPALDIGAGGRVGGGQDGGDFAIGVSQTLELFGEAGLRRKAANVGVKASRLDVERTRFTVHQLVHRSFHNALIADDSVDAAAGAVAFAARLVEVAEAKVRAGDASSLTVRLARTALARAKEQALTAHEEQDSARPQRHLVAPRSPTARPYRGAGAAPRTSGR